jgi:plasmid stabilization system protein ParE
VASPNSRTNNAHPFGAAARADLDEIWLYVARESSTEYATLMITSITDRFALFAKFPYIGKSLESAQRPNVRIFSANNHVIFYSVKPSEIRILRVIHGSRDAQAVFVEP